MLNLQVTFSSLDKFALTVISSSVNSWSVSGIAFCDARAKVKVGDFLIIELLSEDNLVSIALLVFVFLLLSKLLIKERISFGKSFFHICSLGYWLFMMLEILSSLSTQRAALTCLIVSILSSSFERFTAISHIHLMQASLWAVSCWKSSGSASWRSSARYWLPETSKKSHTFSRE